MKLFRPYYFILIVLTIGITSCEDNYTIEGEEEIIISDPQEVESTLVTGRVLDINNEAISDAEIRFRHNDEFTTIYSDLLGDYSFEVPKDDSRVYMQVHAEDYITSGINPLTLDAERKEKNIKLLTSEELGHDGETNLLSQQTNATISGQVLYADGNPAEDIKIILLELANFRFKSYGVTDANGFYSISSEPFDDYLIFAYSECDGVETIAQNISLNNTDIDFGIYESNFSEIEQFSISGEVINCNTGEALAGGLIEITFEGNSDYFTGTIENGSYNVLVDNCIDASCYNIRISSPQITDGITELTCEPITSNQIDKDYEVCGEEVIYDGEIRILLGNDSLIYLNASAQYDESTDNLLIGGLSNNLTDGIAIIIDADMVGTFGIVFMQISENNIGVYQNYESSTIPFSVEITEFTDRIKGNLFGEVINELGATTPISGTFDIKIQ